MKFTSAACLLFTSFIATNAFAATEGGPWYVGASGDVTFMPDTGVSGTTPGNISYDFNSGGNLALGYAPDSLSNRTGGLRLELEGGYHAFGLNDVTAGGAINRNPKGDLAVSTLMGNVYYDLYTQAGFTPYVGAGVGDAHISFDKSNGFGTTQNSTDEFGYQLMAGVSYTPAALPKTDWTLGYRYLGTTSPKFNSTGGNVTFDSLNASSVEVGLRYHF